MDEGRKRNDRHLEGASCTYTSTLSVNMSLSPHSCTFRRPSAAPLPASCCTGFGSTCGDDGLGSGAEAAAGCATCGVCDVGAACTVGCGVSLADTGADAGAATTASARTAALVGSGMSGQSAVPAPTALRASGRSLLARCCRDWSLLWISSMRCRTPISPAKSENRKNRVQPC